MTEVTNELPVSEVYKNVEIYGLQSPERVAEAKRQVDASAPNEVLRAH